jgi:hypothetical protein
MIAGLTTGHVISYLPVLIYAVAIWRIWRGSQAWAIAALVLCVLQGILTLLTLPVIWALVIPFALIGLVKGVRGTAVLSSFPADARASQ